MKSKIILLLCSLSLGLFNLQRKTTIQSIKTNFKGSNENLLSELSAINYDYLTQNVYSKNNNIWKIQVFNPNTIDLEVFYNTKMCNFNDARDWTNLKNLDSLQIASKHVTYVTIMENLFATSIAFSFIVDNYRFITYANYLSENNTLTSYTNTLKIPC